MDIFIFFLSSCNTGQNHSSTSLTEVQLSSTDPMETESTFQPFQAAPVSTSQSGVGMNMKPASVLPSSGGFVHSMPASGSVIAAPTVAVPTDDDDFADFQQAAAPVTTFQGNSSSVFFIQKISCYEYNIMIFY